MESAAVETLPFAVRPGSRGPVISSHLPFSLSQSFQFTETTGNRNFKESSLSGAEQSEGSKEWIGRQTAPGQPRKTSDSSLSLVPSSLYVLNGYYINWKKQPWYLPLWLCETSHFTTSRISRTSNQDNVPPLVLTSTEVSQGTVCPLEELLLSVGKIFPLVAQIIWMTLIWFLHFFVAGQESKCLIIDYIRR